MMLATRRHIAPIAIFALLLQLGLSLPASAGLVLCVGSDGHVAVESGGVSGCGPLAQSPANSCDELGYSAPCSDTPVYESPLLSATSPRVSDPDASLALAPPFASNPPPIADASTRALATALAGPSRTQRTAILRL